MILPEGAKYIIDVIEKEKYEAFAVGGCVRDFLMERPVNDIDITTGAEPEIIENIFDKNHIKYVETGLKHGTITAVFDKENYEVTTYRTDGKYSDNRHPENVMFVKDIKEDLARRDFTMNAIAYNRKKGFVDLYGGRSDIENKIIRTVGDADKRFNEDALRIMRAIRFASVLSFDIEESTEKAIFKNKELLKNVSSERILKELSKLLLGDNVFHVLIRYREVLAVVIPEIKEMFDLNQNTKWHIYDVWAHTCKAVESAPRDSALRLTMLLHDIGKPQCRSTDEKGIDHYYGHPKVSEQIAGPLLKRFKVSNEIYNRVMTLIPIHDAHIGTEKKNIKKWLSKIGEERLIDLIYVKRADKLAQNTDLVKEELKNLEITEKLTRKIIEDGEPFTVKDLSINGNDLISIGFKGRVIGEILSVLLDKVISGELENKKEILVSYACSLYEDKSTNQTL